MTQLTLDSAMLLNVIFSAPNAKLIDDIRGRLSNIVLPWRKDSASPPKWVRKTATGVQVGIVDSWLGGYANPHVPEERGWGYVSSSPHGQGACTRGIASVDCSGLMHVDEQIALSLQRAKDEVDGFLNLEFPYLVLLEEDSE